MKRINAGEPLGRRLPFSSFSFFLLAGEGSVTATVVESLSLAHRAPMFFTTNHTFAGRSARRRMYHGNQ